MPGWSVSWNPGMTLAALLLVAGGACVVVADDLGDPLYKAGVGILALASAVYLGSRIWMRRRRSER